MEEGWKHLGIVGVDSGQLLICDPCYIDSEWKKEEFDPVEYVFVFPDGKREKVKHCSKRWYELIEDVNTGKIKLEENKKPSKENFSYNACCAETIDKSYGQLYYDMGHAGVGVVFSSGFGDGAYNVYGYFRNYGTKNSPDFRIAEIKIVLITEKELKVMEALIHG